MQPTNKLIGANGCKYLGAAAHTNESFKYITVVSGSLMAYNGK